MTEDEMVGWHHRLDGREFGWTPGLGDGQQPGMLQYTGRRELDTTGRLNDTTVSHGASSVSHQGRVGSAEKLLSKDSQPLQAALAQGASFGTHGSAHTGGPQGVSD